MRGTTASSVIALLCMLGLAAASPARGQGCTLGLPAGVENAVDSLLLGACERHDACWRARNPCGGPYLDTSWKASCDLEFLADLTAVCLAATTILSFPNPDFSSAADFLRATGGGKDSAGRRAPRSVSIGAATAMSHVPPGRPAGARWPSSSA